MIYQRVYKNSFFDHDIYDENIGLETISTMTEYSGTWLSLT